MSDLINKYIYIQYWIFIDDIKILVWTIIYTHANVYQSSFFRNMQYVDMSKHIYIQSYTSKHMYIDMIK